METQAFKWWWKIRKTQKTLKIRHDLLIMPAERHIIINTLNDYKLIEFFIQVSYNLMAIRLFWKKISRPHRAKSQNGRFFDLALWPLALDDFLRKKHWISLHLISALKLFLCVKTAYLSYIKAVEHFFDFRVLPFFGCPSKKYYGL